MSRARRVRDCIGDWLHRVAANRRFLGIALRTWWTLVLAVAVSSVGSWVAIDHTNASQDRQQVRYRADQDRRQSLARRQLRDAFNRALRISSAQSNFSINKGVCGWRAFGQPQLDRALKRRSDYPNETAKARALNESAITTLRKFLANQVTVPPGFNCARLGKP